MYNILLIIHLLSATIWIGGHLVLILGFLPKALIQKDPKIIEFYESVYEKIGIPALLLQVITGVWMGFYRIPNFPEWWNWNNYTGRLLGLKLGLLILTLSFAVHARFRIIPTLSAEKLPVLGLHILGVTVLGILFALIGLSFRIRLF